MAGMEEYLLQFEREEFGTNDMPEILDIIRQRERERVQESLTGMPEEQEDWEADDED